MTLEDRVHALRARLHAHQIARRRDVRSTSSGGTISRPLPVSLHVSQTLPPWPTRPAQAIDG